MFCKQICLKHQREIAILSNDPLLCFESVSDALEDSGVVLPSLQELWGLIEDEVASFGYKGLAIILDDIPGCYLRGIMDCIDSLRMKSAASQIFVTPNTSVEVEEKISSSELYRLNGLNLTEVVLAKNTKMESKAFEVLKYLCAVCGRHSRSFYVLLNAVKKNQFSLKEKVESCDFLEAAKAFVKAWKRFAGNSRIPRSFKERELCVATAHAIVQREIGEKQSPICRLSNDWFYYASRSVFYWKEAKKGYIPQMDGIFLYLFADKFSDTCDLARGVKELMGWVKDSNSICMESIYSAILSFRLMAFKELGNKELTMEEVASFRFLFFFTLIFFS